MKFQSGPYQEIWIDGEHASSLCALIHGELGWLMYLPNEDGGSYSSRNPDYQGDMEAELDFLLSNGQLDSYPLAWCLPLERVEAALNYFKTNGQPPSFVVWHDDQQPDDM